MYVGVVVAVVNQKLKTKVQYKTLDVLNVAGFSGYQTW